MDMSLRSLLDGLKESPLEEQSQEQSQEQEHEQEQEQKEERIEGRTASGGGGSNGSHGSTDTSSGDTSANGRDLHGDEDEEEEEDEDDADSDEITAFVSRELTLTPKSPSTATPVASASSQTLQATNRTRFKRKDPVHLQFERMFVQKEPSFVVRGSAAGVGSETTGDSARAAGAAEGGGATQSSSSSIDPPPLPSMTHPGSARGGKEGIRGSRGHRAGRGRSSNVPRTEPSSTAKSPGLMSLLEQWPSDLGGGDGSSDEEDFSDDGIDESSTAFSGAGLLSRIMREIEGEAAVAPAAAATSDGDVGGEGEPDTKVRNSRRMNDSFSFPLDDGQDDLEDELYVGHDSEENLTADIEVSLGQAVVAADGILAAGGQTVSPPRVDRREGGDVTEEESYVIPAGYDYMMGDQSLVTQSTFSAPLEGPLLDGTASIFYVDRPAGGSHGGTPSTVSDFYDSILDSMEGLMPEELGEGVAAVADALTNGRDEERSYEAERHPPPPPPPRRLIPERAASSNTAGLISSGEDTGESSGAITGPGPLPSEGLGPPPAELEFQRRRPSASRGSRSLVARGGRRWSGDGDYDVQDNNDVPAPAPQSRLAAAEARSDERQHPSSSLAAAAASAAPAPSNSTRNSVEDPFFVAGERSAAAGMLAEAKAMFLSSLQDRVSNLGASHPSVCDVLERLGGTTAALGQVDEAHVYYSLALRGVRLHSTAEELREEEEWNGTGLVSPVLGDDDDGDGSDEQSRRLSRRQPLRRRGSWRERAEARARIHLGWGDLHFRSGNCHRALQFYGRAMSIWAGGLLRGSSGPGGGVLSGVSSHPGFVECARRAVAAHEQCVSTAIQRRDRDMVLFHYREIFYLLGHLNGNMEGSQEGLGSFGNGAPSLEENMAEVVRRVGAQCIATKQANPSVGDFSYAKETARLLMWTGEEVTVHAIVSILDIAANSHQRHKELNCALRCLKEKLHLLARSAGEMNDIAKSALQIGCLYNEIGKPEDAVRYFDKALKVKVECLGRGSSEVRLLCRIVGSSHLAIGNHSQAIRYFKEFLPICTKDEAIDMLNTLGVIYSKVEYMSDALVCYVEALESEFGGSNGDGVSALIHNMQDMFISPKKFTKSADFLERALDFRDMQQILTTLGVVQLKRRSSPHARRCLDDLRSHFDMRDVNSIRVLKCMGNMLFRRCRYKEAIDFYERYLNNRDFTGIPQTGEPNVLENLATSYLMVGAMEKSANVSDRALQELGRTHGKRDWEDSTAPLCEKLGIVNSATSSATALALDSAESSRSPPIHETKEMLVRRRHLEGVGQCHQGKFDQALQIFKDMLQSMAKYFEENPLDAIKLHVDMINVYLLKGDTVEVQRAVDAAMRLSNGEGAVKHHPVFWQLDRLNKLHNSASSGLLSESAVSTSGESLVSWCHWSHMKE